LINIHRHSNPIDKLCIFMLGDIVEGTTIFSGQLMRAEPMAIQLLHLWQKISEFVLGMCKNFKQVEVSCVWGNHGRITKENLSWDNNDYILYKMLEDKTQHQPNLKWNITTMKHQIAKVEGWKFLLTHGNEIRRHMGFPWYSQSRTEGNYRKLVKVDKEDFDFFVHGHHHSPAQIDSFTGEIICNGTFSVGNSLVRNELVQWSRPTQKLFGVHKRTGIAWSRNIRLDIDRRKV
jgi:predicted phosphodiesterase